jgi:4-aminobutyrate aminotransferase
LYGITLTQGNGCYITDADNNQYLDCLSSASANCLGYHNPQLVEAYTQAANHMQHSCFLYSPNLQAIELAKKLIEITPGTFDKRVMFGLSGSDSCDGAIKATRKYTGCFGIIHFKNDYHGSTGLSMPASDFSNLNSGIFSQSNAFIELSYPQTTDEAHAILQSISHLLQSRKAGGVLAEVIQGDNGVRQPPKGFFNALYQATQTHGAVLIIDEVQTGMGRTGKWWAIEHEEVTPDIIVTAKALSAGYAPISAAIGRAEILNSLAPAQHVFTYSGHGPSAAVALKNIQTIESENLIASNQRIGDDLLSFFRNLKTQFTQVIVDVRGRGLMIGIEINCNIDQWAGKIFATRCVELGLYVGFFGDHAQVIRIEPPYTLNNSEIATIKTVIETVCKEFVEGKVPYHTIKNVRQYSLGL